MQHYPASACILITMLMTGKFTFGQSLSFYFELTRVVSAPSRLTSSTFSQDSTLMAAGFEESYVQVWSLKGEKLNGLRSDFDLTEVRDGE